MQIGYNDIIETSAHQFMTEASTLGMAPGKWPEEINTDIGNGQPLIPTTKKVDKDGDLVYVRYVQFLGIISVLIYNT